MPNRKRTKPQKGCHRMAQTPRNWNNRNKGVSQIGGGQVKMRPDKRRISPPTPPRGLPDFRPSPPASGERGDGGEGGGSLENPVCHAPFTSHSFCSSPVAQNRLLRGSWSTPPRTSHSRKASSPTSRSKLDCPWRPSTTLRRPNRLGWRRN